MAARACNSHHMRSADTHSDVRQLVHMQSHRTCSTPTKDSYIPNTDMAAQVFLAPAGPKMGFYYA